MVRSQSGVTVIVVMATTSCDHVHQSRVNSHLGQSLGAYPIEFLTTPINFKLFNTCLILLNCLIAYHISILPLSRSMLEEEQLNKEVISKKLKELEYQLELKARARQETRGIEEIANKELANINALRVAFVDDLQSRIKQTNTQVGSLGQE